MGVVPNWTSPSMDQAGRIALAKRMLPCIGPCAILPKLSWALYRWP